MITYQDFIKRMEEKEYIFNRNNPITIDESSDLVHTFSMKQGQIAKVLELQCPNYHLISLCGKTHVGGCSNSYECDIKCYDDNGKEPFQKLHYSMPLENDHHIVAEIIVTKILQKDPKNTEKVRTWRNAINPILRLIGSNNPREHVMWVGAYPIFKDEFTKTSFTLYKNEKMLFYINNPDIDISKIIFKLKADIFKHRQILESQTSEGQISEELYIPIRN